ncbi:MAG TPA: hypothetical protein VEK56_03925 [Vicinamibacterales bacterium]|nr:hypothetical protein [Vicinamibacterales bacterium]
MISIEPRFGASTKLFRTLGCDVYEEKTTGDWRRRTLSALMLFFKCFSVFVKLLDRHTKWVTSR